MSRCDHESGCGYHVTPAQYFREHPELTGKDWCDDKPAWLDAAIRRREQEKQKPLCTIPDQYIVRSVRPEKESDFPAWLGTIIPPQTVHLLVKEYRIGITKAGDVIFFQIDR